MIRMCDTMQTWKWGGFGLGWRVGRGGEKGESEDSLHPGWALCGAALEAALPRGRGGTDRHLAPSPFGERQAEAVMVARLRPPLPR